jgi:hypothetical protein
MSEALQTARKAIYKRMESEGFEPDYNFGGEFEGIEYDGEIYGNSNDIYLDMLKKQKEFLKLFDFVCQIEVIEEKIY